MNQVEPLNWIKKKHPSKKAGDELYETLNGKYLIERLKGKTEYLLDVNHDGCQRIGEYPSLAAASIAADEDNATRWKGKTNND